MEKENATQIAGNDMDELTYRIVTSPKRSKFDPAKLNFDVGYNLGWDAYKYGMDTKGWRSEFDSCRLGYMQAKEKRVRRAEELDRFVKKWFQIRFGAWKRNRQFNDNVTPDFLRQIDQVCCPVTREKLTHGLMLPTDWSVDRINNDAAYSVNNLCVMSVRANTAKSHYGFEKILEFAYDFTKPIPSELIQDNGNVLTPLTRDEWARMLVIAASAPVMESDTGKAQAEDLVVPCVLLPTNGMVTTNSSILQVLLAYSAHYSKLHGNVLDVELMFYRGGEAVRSKGLTSANKKAYNKMVSRCLKANYDLREPVSMWKNQALFLHFIKFYDGLSSIEKENIYKVMNSVHILGDHVDETPQSLGLESRGYMRRN